MSDESEPMRIFIWESDGISSAYHDDGTLVVLATSTTEAREIVRSAKQQNNKASEEILKAANSLGYSEPYYWRQADEKTFKEVYEEMHKKFPLVSGGEWDGSDEALDREPDEIIELDKPKFITFNGGGYD